MNFTGKCYCGELTYKAEGEPVMKGQCHCRECQYISGGGPNYFLIMPTAGFEYTKGEPSQFTRSDIENPRTRDFCKTCGTHITTRLPGGKMIVVKVGTMDDPSEYGGPKVAIFTCDMPDFHTIAEGIPTFDKRPS
ncbi:GFA family protein [Pseudahrensia aquimaris]|uniref:GFA family protein n=1 Tax=Pseudahrensia aquimaris TaxID=744461 RepID=A0ABW3FEZ0_9HYPH